MKGTESAHPRLHPHRQQSWRELWKMPGLWKTWKADGRLSHSFHEPLGISTKAGEIPTFPQLRRQGRMERRKTKITFPTSPPPRFHSFHPPKTPAANVLRRDAPRSPAHEFVNILSVRQRAGKSNSPDTQLRTLEGTPTKVSENSLVVFASVRLDLRRGCFPAPEDKNAAYRFDLLPSAPRERPLRCPTTSHGRNAAEHRNSSAYQAPVNRGREATEFMGRSETAMRQLIHKRLVPVVRFGRNVRVDIRDLEHLIEENRM